MKNRVQLITYVDRLGGGGIDDLRALLAGDRAPLGGLFGAVHLLPFFHPIDGADAGFDPIDHLRVDPRLGDWAAVRRLSSEVDVMADVIVNHMSTGSPQFLDWLRHGDASPYAGLFLTYGSVFPDGASEADLLALYRPRPGLPFTAVQLGDGSRRLLWTTFTAQQVDIAVRHPQGLAYLEGILRRFADNGIGTVRLDAVGYAIKKPGATGFMMPETFDFIGEFAARARALGIEVLVEVHSHHRQQIEIARRVDWVYDFALPPLVLHALHAGDGEPLTRWIGIRPANALTVLDTHDGIGIVDVGPDPRDRAGLPGLLSSAQLDALVEHVHRASGGQSLRATGAAASNLDLYQVNCTFYDALGADDDAYLAARAIQFFLPGVPQVYYVGLLAGRNDMTLLERTQVGRDINRHHFTAEEIDAALRSEVVRRLLALIRLRNTHPAFGGQFETLVRPPGQLAMRWRADGGGGLRLEVDLRRRRHRLIEEAPDGPREL